jgi:hypothetical protein
LIGLSSSGLAGRKTLDWDERRHSAQIDTMREVLIVHFDQTILLKDVSPDDSRTRPGYGYYALVEAIDVDADQVTIVDVMRPVCASVSGLPFCPR